MLSTRTLPLAVVLLVAGTSPAFMAAGAELPKQPQMGFEGRASAH
jgi:hypothetical protein